MSKFLNTFFFSLLALICLLSGFGPGIVSCDEASQDTAYRLGAEDVVSILIIAGGVEQVKTQMVVGDNGSVNVPFIGKRMAAGLTLADLEKAIVIPLEENFFVDPQVHLQIVEYHSLKFFISGAVKKPGKYELDFTPTIMDLVANAGGVLPERGNLAYIIKGLVTSQDMDDSEIKASISKKEPIKVDLIKLLDEGDMSVNIKLKSGDTVYIPLSSSLNQTTSKVFVQGKVKNAGVIAFQPGLTALAACIMAGGFDKFAAPNRAKIIRTENGVTETIDLNLNLVISGKLPDVQLKPGDRIHIPESWL